MSRLSEVFEHLSCNGAGAYIPYVCVGDPDIEFTHDLVEALSRAGADIIELGVPFSDPVADGPIVQSAMKRSLSAGLRVRQVFDTLSLLRREGLKQPIVLMTYFNPMMTMGIRRFCDRLARSGGDAVLPVDLPVDESRALDEAARREGLDVIRLVAPSTNNERLDLILSRATGFVYVVSVSGVTGPRDRLSASARRLIERVSNRSTIPVALGFGVSRPEHVRQAISAGASGLVEGSKLISTYADLLDNRARAIAAVERHARKMKKATVL